MPTTIKPTDPVPGGTNGDRFVLYTVDGMPGTWLFGPLETVQQARTHQQDIGGFEGVSASVVPRADIPENRVL